MNDLIKKTEKIKALGLKRTFKKVILYSFQFMRVKFYKVLSENPPLENYSKIVQPVVFSGRGQIVLKKCQLGVSNSPQFYSGTSYIEARSPESKIIISDGVSINNNATIISDKSQIFIASNCLIGPGLNIYDSDFHELSPDLRSSGNHQSSPVHIEENVFIGSNVTILKGVTIGKNSVIASGSVVVKNIPGNVIAGGNPAQVLKQI
jgi:acetyltransferase-like isoleucine patch superfamily enzyme